MIALNPANPSPFIQPLLVLVIKGRDPWFVDVDGCIDLYLDKSRINALPRTRFSTTSSKLMKPHSFQGDVLANVATTLLKETAQGLAEHGILITRVDIYVGSAGPSHILRHGAFFERRSEFNHPVYEQDDTKWMTLENVQS